MASNVSKRCHKKAGSIADDVTTGKMNLSAEHKIQAGKNFVSGISFLLIFFVLVLNFEKFMYAYLFSRNLPPLPTPNSSLIFSPTVSFQFCGFGSFLYPINTLILPVCMDIEPSTASWAVSQVPISV